MGKLFNVRLRNELQIIKEMCKWFIQPYEVMKSLKPMTIMVTHGEITRVLNILGMQTRETFKPLTTVFKHFTQGKILHAK